MCEQQQQQMWTEVNKRLSDGRMKESAREMWRMRTIKMEMAANLM